MTGHEWVVTLRFIVPRNTFKPEARWPPSCARPVPRGAEPGPLRRPARGRRQRPGGAGQEVAITCHAAADIETPAFEAFLARAVSAYEGSPGAGNWPRRVGGTEPVDTRRMGP